MRLKVACGVLFVFVVGVLFVLAVVAVVSVRSFRASPVGVAPSATETAAEVQPVFAAVPVTRQSPKPQISVATAAKVAGSQASGGDEPRLTERQRALFAKHGRSVTKFYTIAIEEEAR